MIQLTKYSKMKYILKIFLLVGFFFFPQLLSSQVNGSTEEKRAALHALAAGGDPASLTILAKAAKDAGYKQDSTEAVSSLLLYASVTAGKGDLTMAEKSAGMVIKNCITPETNGFRVEAMKILTENEKEKALPVLLKAIDDKDVKIREAVVQLANTVPGTEATNKWIARYPKVSPEAKVSILILFGGRNDTLALPLVKTAMEDKNLDISGEAVSTLAKLIKNEAVDPILSWMLKVNSERGHVKAADVLVTILNHDNIDKVAACLKPSTGHATTTLIYLLSWAADKRFFDAVFPYINSSDIAVRAASFSSLKSLTSEKDIDILLKAISQTEERPEIVSLQEALAVAANSSGDEETNSEKILGALKNGMQPEKLIPVLAITGGKDALDYVSSQFDNGNPEMRELCFDALQGWKDWSATSALYNICESGNKTYGKPALDAYLRLASNASVADDQKLALFEKIAPYALYPDSRSEMIVQTGFIKSVQAFNFVSKYLDDQDKTVACSSAQALANIALTAADGTGGLYDQNIRQTLEKAVTILTDDEYSDTREKIKAYLNKEAGK
jgi:HEAT repeat protein